MSLLYLEHHEIIDRINDHREARNLRYDLGRQAVALQAIPRICKSAVQWVKEAWTLRDCVNGQHPELRTIHRETFDLGDGTEKSCRILRCERCGETVNQVRIRPVTYRPETKEPDGCTSGPIALRQ
jgi:hypothetical protein